MVNQYHSPALNHQLQNKQSLHHNKLSWRAKFQPSPLSLWLGFLLKNSHQQYDGYIWGSNDLTLGYDPTRFPTLEDLNTYTPFHLNPILNPQFFQPKCGHFLRSRFAHNECRWKHKARSLDWSWLDKPCEGRCWWRILGSQGKWKGKTSKNTTWKNCMDI